MKYEIWHNPRCRKSREGLAYLESKGAELQVRHYLEQVPTEEELQDVLKRMGLGPRDIIRKQEAVYKELNLKDPGLSDPQLVKAMVENPKLIERPIVIAGDKAALGRPAENLDQLF